MKRTKIETSDYAPTPQVNLTSKVGSKIIGKYKKKVESKNFPENPSYVISAIETDAPIVLYDKQTKGSTEVDINAGDDVFISGSTLLHRAMDQVVSGEKIEIVYKGLGEAKPGRRSPHLFDVYKLED